MFRIVVLSIFVSLLGCSPHSSSSDELVGRWQVTSIMRNGKEVNDPNSAPTFVVFKNGKMTMTKGGKQLGNSDYTTNPAATPKSIDITDEISGSTVKKIGIYEIRDNEAKMCIGSSEQERPQEFTSTINANVLIMKRM